MTAPNAVFTQTPLIGSGITSATPDTSLTAPTNVTTVLTAGSNGTLVTWMRLIQILTTGSGGTINIFIYDGTTYHYYDLFTYGTNTVSTTVNPGAIDFFPPTKLILPTGYTLRVTNTIASGTGSTGATHNMLAFGENF